MQVNVPRPHIDERPAAYAERLGQWYLSWNTAKKVLGQYFTPLRVADFMTQMITRTGSAVHVLDPGAGMGILSCALCEVLSGDVDLETYEIDPDLVGCLEVCLHYTQEWMAARGRSLVFKIIQDDFVTARAWVLESDIQQTLGIFGKSQSIAKDQFDLVIANPPYFKLNKSDPRAKAASAIVHGQPNIYAVFMALGAALLKSGGQLVYITPRSYAAGRYFSRFREYFFSRVRPRAFHLFDSRRDVFGEVLQEALIVHAERSTQDGMVTLTSSSSAVDFANLTSRMLPLTEVLNGDNVLHLPISEQNDQILEIVKSWKSSLHDYGMEISTGPVVPFRATNLVSMSGNVPESHVPLLWMQNVKPMQITWPLSRKGQYLLRTGAEKLMLPNLNYVLLRRFSAKEEHKRLTAAPYLASINTPAVGVENHLNYIYRPHGGLSPDEARGLAVLLNSALMDAYFRIFSGNTQVSATELRTMRLPPLEAIIEMGRRGVV